MYLDFWTLQRVQDQWLNYPLEIVSLHSKKSQKANFKADNKGTYTTNFSMSKLF